MNITQGVNLAIPFIQAGLIEYLGKSGDQSSDGEFMESSTVDGRRNGGNHAARSQRPRNGAASERRCSTGWRANPRTESRRFWIATRSEKRGTYPDAAFLVVLKPGYYTSARALAASWSRPIPGHRGSHGFSPEYPEMRSSFFAVGAGIAHHRDLGLVDMRQIAPTVAGILHVPMPTAKATPLHVQP